MDKDKWNARYSAPQNAIPFQSISDERAAEILGAVRAESGDALAAGPRIRHEAPPVTAEQDTEAQIAQRNKAAEVIAEMNLATHNW